MRCTVHSNQGYIGSDFLKFHEGLCGETGLQGFSFVT